MTAILVLSIIVTVCLLASVVLITVGISHAITDAFRMTDRAHERWVKHTEELHNRLMAKDWQEYVEIKAFEAGDEGGFYTPEEQAMEGDFGPENDDTQIMQLLPKVKGRNADIPRPDADEEKLLAEDFTDDDEPRRGVV